MDEHSPHSERNGTTEQRRQANEPRQRSGQGSASALDSLKKLERDHGWLHQQEEQQSGR
jgi:hypothetical protein